MLLFIQLRSTKLSSCFDQRLLSNAQLWVARQKTVWAERVFFDMRFCFPEASSGLAFFR